MKDGDAFVLFGAVETLNNRPGLRLCGITRSREDDASRRIFGPIDIYLAQADFANRLKNLRKVAFQSHQDRLGFRIAKPDVVLEHLRPADCHHQANEQYAAKRKAFVATSIE